MIFEDSKALQQRIAEVTYRKIATTPQIIEDTSSYMNIVAGCVVRIRGNDYYIVTDAKENRFGVDDQPKFWVKYAIDLTTGTRKLIKLVFYEEFVAEIGPVRIRCKRNPQKEADILDAVRGNSLFMQGSAITDPVGNLVRVIDVISGCSLYHYLAELDISHEEYFFDRLPGIMKKMIGCVEAMAALHEQGMHHGDVRSDHIWIENRTERFVWIDFDYEVSHTDYDLWSMGNLIIRVLGKDVHLIRDFKRHPDEYSRCREAVMPEDLVLLYGDRIANLRKLFPYIPKPLNDIAMKFSAGASEFYSDLRELAEDLHACF